jgi:hypothetical protein
MSSVFTKNYYNNDEFKQKHLSNMKTKVQCDVCNCMVSKGNLSAHKKSQKHIRNIQNNSDNISNEELLKLQTKINKLLNLN